MDLDDLIDARNAAPSRLVQARAHLAAPTHRRASAWPAFGAALFAATAALGAAAGVILGGPGLGEAGTRTLPPVVHSLGS